VPAGRRVPLHTQREIEASGLAFVKRACVFAGLGLFSREGMGVFCCHCQRAESIFRGDIDASPLLVELVPLLKGKLARRALRDG